MWSAFGPFWSGQKLPIRTAHYTFLECRHSELTKNQIMFYPLRGAKKKVSAHGLIGILMESDPAPFFANLFFLLLWT